ncbi:hypothetical protein GCM10023195_55190 [Actinoallomurus liliacearum]|uniref:Methyltransferase n=1 Tax=Actinoallomurus liliacearum TaxID=1080073 RepID=A0ABP8TSJ4_9ACTN
MQTEQAHEHLNRLEIGAMAQQNRDFLGRVVRWLAAQGFRQFVDLSVGVAAGGHVHEVLATLQLDDCRVLYAHDGPIEWADAEAFIAGTHTVRLEADPRRPDGVLGHPRTQKLIDTEQPVALLALEVLHFVADADDPAGLVGEYMKGLPDGSCLAYTHRTDRYAPEGVAALEAIYQTANYQAHPRTIAVIEELATVSGLVIQNPGIVKVTDWNPGGEIMAPLNDPAIRMPLVGGVAQKPLMVGVAGDRG